MTASLDRTAKEKRNNLFRISSYLIQPNTYVAHPLIKIYRFLLLVILVVVYPPPLQIRNVFVLRRAFNAASGALTASQRTDNGPLLLIFRT